MEHKLYLQRVQASTDNVCLTFLGVQTDVAVIDSGSITNQTELAESSNGDLLLIYDTSVWRFEENSNTKFSITI